MDTEDLIEHALGSRILAALHTGIAVGLTENQVVSLIRAAQADQRSLWSENHHQDEVRRTALLEEAIEGFRAYCTNVETALEIGGPRMSSYTVMKEMLSNAEKMFAVKDGR